MPWNDYGDTYLPEYSGENVYTYKDPLSVAAENEAQKASDADWASRGSGKATSRSVSGTGGGSSGGYGTTSVTNMGKYESLPTAPAVTPLTLPKYTMPVYDEQERKKEVQKAAAPGLMNLRHQVQTAMMRKNENPNVTRMTLRDALAGYGTGLGQVMGSAEKAGGAAYGEKYGRASQEAQMNWQTESAAAQANWTAQNAREMTNYSALLQDYMKSTYSPGSTGGVGGMSAAQYYEKFQRPGVSYRPGGMG